MQVRHEIHGHGGEGLLVAWALALLAVGSAAELPAHGAGAVVGVVCAAYWWRASDLGAGAAGFGAGGFTAVRLGGVAVAGAVVAMDGLAG